MHGEENGKAMVEVGRHLCILDIAGGIQNAKLSRHYPLKETTVH
jgi:hypothetical protein